MKKYTRPITSICLLFMLITGCIAPAKPSVTPADNALENQAQDFLAQGNYNAAADEYIRLAGINKKNADPFLLKAASAYLAGNDPEHAQSTIIMVKEQDLTDIQSAERRILHARIALLQNNADTALLMLDFQLTADTPRELAADYYLSRALAYEMQGQLFNAVRSRVQLGSYLDVDEEQRNNQRTIWDLLSQPGAIDQKTDLDSNETELAGWLDLAIIANTLLANQTELAIAIDAWQQRYESHPAAAQIVPELIAMAATSTIKPRQIALLLPFNTQYYDAATAIRDGFLAAWYEAPVTADKPVIRIYNTSDQDIMSVYDQAVADGADFMAGPLEKEAVATLLAANNLKVRVLALNQISAGHDQNTGNDAVILPSIFQFGLLPEDETYQVADMAWFNGLANALVITPDTGWGDRIFNAFRDRWVQLGGRIIAHTRISGGSQDLAVPVKQLFNIDKSEARAKELTSVLGKKIHAEPRHRQDADLVFLAAPPLVARQLIPQFRFFGVNNIAIYSSSSVYSGIPDPEADSDINGVIFADMPWLIDAELEQSPLQQTLNRSWNQNKSSYRRLYAFGIDAYRLISGLAELALQKNGEFDGVTGTLHVTSQGYIQRTPVWVNVVNGLPQRLDEKKSAK